MIIRDMRLSEYMDILADKYTLIDDEVQNFLDFFKKVHKLYPYSFLSDAEKTNVEYLVSLTMGNTWGYPMMCLGLGAIAPTNTSETKTEPEIAIQLKKVQI